MKRVLIVIIAVTVLIGIGVAALKFFLSLRYEDKERRNYQLIREKSKLNCDELPIHCAVRDKDLALLNSLERGDGRIESLDGWFRTPLYLAITLADKEAVEILLGKGANPNVFDEYGRPALLASVEKNLYEVAEVLIKHGARVDIEVKGVYPLFSPLDYCVTNNDLRCVVLLLENGADADKNRSHQVIVRNSFVKNISIYEMAMSNSNVSVEMKQLLEDRRNKTFTPIHSGQRINQLGRVQQTEPPSSGNDGKKN
jgi:ankyrin repeat protein